MPGATIDLTASGNYPRGLRSPRIISGVSECDRRVLQPFLAHPLRPGESLVGLSVNCDLWLNTLVSWMHRPFLAGEVAFWYLPLSAMHQFFVDLYTGTPQDVIERAVETEATGTAARIAPNPVTIHGHRYPQLQRAVRRWAGEIGGNSGGNGLAGSEYAPYVSFATYKVAQDWYDLALPNSAVWEDDNLFDQPPGLGPYIRGALKGGFTAGDDDVDPDPSSATTLSDLIEQMFLLAQPEMTYAEILANHNVSPRRAGGIAQPVMLEHFNLQPMGSPQMFGNFTAIDQTVLEIGTGTDPDDSVGATQPISSSDRVQQVWDKNMYGMLGMKDFWFRRRSMFVTEPGVLLGTIALYQENFRAADYAHTFDMTRMTHPGHWGRRTAGGIDEEDFLAVQDIFGVDGLGHQAGARQDQVGDEFMFNLLNLYLHGETVNVGTNGADTDGLNHFEFRYPGGGAALTSNNHVNGHISTQLHVLSDLVA